MCLRLNKERVQPWWKASVAATYSLSSRKGCSRRDQSQEKACRSLPGWRRRVIGPRCEVLERGIDRWNAVRGSIPSWVGMEEGLQRVSSCSPSCQQDICGGCACTMDNIRHSRSMLNALTTSRKTQSGQDLLRIKWCWTKTENWCQRFALKWFAATHH